MTNCELVDETGLVEWSVKVGTGLAPDPGASIGGKRGLMRGPGPPFGEQHMVVPDTNTANSAPTIMDGIGMAGRDFVNEEPEVTHV